MGVAMGICGLQLFWNITGNLEVSVDLNGTSGDMVDFQSTGDVGNSVAITEMGNLVPEPSYEEAEKARLWSVATMNCIDFDAWTTVVEETDKNAEVMTNNNNCYACYKITCVLTATM
ncbi:hypothetical protein Zm00014a_034810 [Zea mays]|uniref:Uncharacterized protein n=1 Tax=Zea mays TaxID=4577 RepID=A0A3L6DG50_MAIZE|nr:hypothetical protein Zm00014a_034810 [Zea mays]